MSERYVTRPFGYIADDAAFEWRPDPRTIAVIEDERRAVRTGLLDANGNELYRVRAAAPFGFMPQKAKA